MTNSLYALHGFLGLPSDWQGFQSIRQHCKEFFPIDIFQKGLTRSSLEAWAQSLNATVAKDNKPSVLIGYSLGARLGMHAVIAEPALWKGAIFISGNPGLSQEVEKQRRLEADAIWAKRFREDPWEELMEKWNHLDVFAGFKCTLERREEQYTRAQLAESLIHWSLGTQENLQSKLQELKMPILWLVGEQDVKYTQLARNLVFKNPHSQMRVIPQAAHRVPWENGRAFEESVINFLENISKG